MKDFLKELGKLAEVGATTDVLKRAHRSCDHQEPLNDFCQSVLLHAILNHESFRGGTTAELLGWLKAMGQRMASRVRHRAHPIGQALLADVADRIRSSDAEEDALVAAQAATLRWLDSTLAALSAEDLLLLRRHYWGHERTGAIAKDLETSASTVRQRLIPTSPTTACARPITVNRKPRK